MQYYQMNEEQLVSHFNNQLNNNETIDEEKGEKFNLFLSRLVSVFNVCRARFSFVFIIILICHFLNLVFSILNKDWRLLIIGLTLFLASCLFATVECMTLFYKRRQYEERILANESNVKVIRNGEEFEIDIAQLRCGDRLILTVGDVIPADLRVILANNLYVNEEGIFGKTIPVLKCADVINGEKLYPEQQDNMVWSGSYITGGSCEAIVVAVKEDCLIEKIGRRKNVIQKSAIYNQKNNIGKITTIIYSVLCVILLLIAGGLTGKWLEALLIFSSFLSLFIIDPSSFVTEWVYYNTAENLFKNEILVRNIQAFDGINKEKVLYVLPSDLIDRSNAYDEIININGSESSNRIFVQNSKECFGRAELTFDRNEGDTFAIAFGYWKEMLPFIKNMDDSLREYIREFETHGYIVGAICAKEIYFTPQNANKNDFFGELSLRCLALKQISLDKNRFDELRRLKKNGMNVYLAKEYSGEVSNYIAGYCDIKVVEESSLQNNTYSFPSKSDYAVFSNAAQVQKKNAKIIFKHNSPPIQTIYKIKCMICGIERSLNFLYILLIGLIAGSFVCFLKSMEPKVAFPILMLHLLLIFLCHHIAHSVKNCDQSKLSFVIGGLFATTFLVSSFIIESGSIAALGFSFVLYAALLYSRRIKKSKWNKKELVGMLIALILAALVCLFFDLNLIVVLLFAAFPALATILIDLIY